MGKVGWGGAGSGKVRFGELRISFLRIHKRQDNDIWRKTRKRIWERDERKCVRCGIEVVLSRKEARLTKKAVANIDHIIRVKKGGNKDENLRTLCKRCHVLRKDFGHRGMIAKALKESIIGPGWREEVWE